MVSVTQPHRSAPHAASGARNLGIDLLRIVSVYYVLVLHAMGQGGILDALKPGSLRYTLCWAVEMWCFCAVNIFAMISGYVGFTHEPKRNNFPRYLLNWLQVVFYGVCMCAVFAVIRPELVDLKAVLKAIFPVSSGAHWYFTSYTGLFLLIPLINLIVRQLNRRYLKGLLLVILLLFSFYDSVLDRFGLLYGYSTSWLGIVYLIGAIMKKCEIGRDMPAWKAFFGIVICSLLSFGWKMLMPETYLLGVRNSDSLAQSYLFFPHLLTAMFHMMLFSRLRIPEWLGKLIRFGAAGVFGVYLVNTNYLLWTHIWPSLFSQTVNWRISRMLLFVAGFSFVFLIVFTFVDLIRQKLFQLLRIDKLAKVMAEAAVKAVNQAAGKLFS